MNFDFTDDQQAIKRTARDFLADRLKPERRRELAEGGDYDDGLWEETAELGWAGIHLAEEHGGQGLGAVELAILMEEMGYALAPSPFFASAAASLALGHAGSDAQRERWLGPLASGEAVGTVGLVTDGVAPMVPDADRAEVIVLVDGLSGMVVEAASAEIAEQPTIDSTRRFSRVSASGGEPLEGDVMPALDRIEVALAAELVGIAQRTMEMAVEYAKEREQFGRPIGTNQAVSHRCAQMMLEVESARSTTLYAAWTADHEPGSLPLASSMAKSYASDAGSNVTTSSLQVHGGIGFTWEHDLHFFLKRARTDRHLFGSPRSHRERVATLAGLGELAA
jgi:alkylation response protein AidB-like acyl-CoA dehydrogenase